MAHYLKGPYLIPIIIVVFMIVIGIATWSLDLISQQRTFAFFISAELIALAMLVYLYYEEDPKEIRQRWLLKGSAALVVVVILGVAVLPGLNTSATQKPNVNITLYEGEISSTLYGFGYNSSDLNSPGPTLTFNVSNVVNMTVTDVGQLPHNWAIVNSVQAPTSVLFNAQIKSASNPLESGESGSVIFTVNQGGKFYYVCQVAGHADAGMWGDVVVNP